MTSKVTIIMPSEPQIDLQLTGIKNSVQRGDVLQVTIPLSLLKTLMTQVQQALAEAGVQV